MSRKPVSRDPIANEVFGKGGFAEKLREQLLSPQLLARKAQERVLGNPPTSVNCRNVNNILCRLLDIEYEIYLESEKESFEKIGEYALIYRSEYPEISKIIEQSIKVFQYSSDPEDKLKRCLSIMSPLYKAVAESFAQGRKQRAGVSAQYHVAFVLDQLGFKDSYEMQRVLNGRVDFLFPNYRTWVEDRRRCTILSIKRSLRERYKQVYQELDITRGLTVYLMVTETLEEAENDITITKVNELKNQNIYLVVRDQIKSVRFENMPHVYGFTQFFCSELPMLRERWTR